MPIFTNLKNGLTINNLNRGLFMDNKSMVLKRVHFIKKAFCEYCLEKQCNLQFKISFYWNTILTCSKVCNGIDN